MNAKEALQAALELIKVASFKVDDLHRRNPTIALIEQALAQPDSELGALQTRITELEAALRDVIARLPRGSYAAEAAEKALEES